VAKKKALTREQIIAKAKTERLELPELGGVVYIRSMPWPLQAKFQRLRDSEGLENGDLSETESRLNALAVLEGLVPDIMLYCVADESGGPVMANEEEVDAVLRTVGQDTVITVVNAVFAYSGMTEEGLEDIEKN